MDLDRRKKEATIAFTHEILERVGDLCRIITNEYAKEPVKYEEYQANPEMRETIREFLNIMERLSVGINSGVYDFDIYYRICGSSTVLYWNQLSHVIDKKRKEMQHPSLYVEYERLAEMVKERNKQAEDHRGDVHEKL